MQPDRITKRLEIIITAADLWLTDSFYNREPLASIDYFCSQVNSRVESRLVLFLDTLRDGATIKSIETNQSHPSEVNLWNPILD